MYMYMYVHVHVCTVHVHVVYHYYIATILDCTYRLYLQIVATMLCLKFPNMSTSTLCTVGTKLCCDFVL